MRLTAHTLPTVDVQLPAVSSANFTRTRRVLFRKHDPVVNTSTTASYQDPKRSHLLYRAHEVGRGMARSFVYVSKERTECLYDCEPSLAAVIQEMRRIMERSRESTPEI